jgi:hypothetical protein
MSRQRPGSRRQPRRRSGRSFPTAWVITGLIVVGVIGALILLTRPTSQTAAAEVECNRNEHFTQHAHANLRIYINGEQVPLPANVGIRPGDCLYWLHTHDGSGTIHVEAPVRDRVFTLGQFFKVWDRTLSSTEMMGYQVDETHQIKAWVNGEEYTGDPAEIPLRQHAVITLQYGPPFQPPHTHQFQPNE